MNQSDNNIINKDIINNDIIKPKQSDNVFIDKATNIMNDTVNITSSVKTEVIDTINNFIKDPNIFYGLIIVIIVSIISALIIYYFVVEKIFNKRSITVEETKFPIKGYVQTSIPLNNLIINSNGINQTYTFWIYLNDMTNMKGMYKNVFSIGPKDSLINNKSIIVFLDKENNKMYIKLGSKNETDNATLNTLNISNKEIFESCVVIPYIPLQRWVHIGIVINDGILNGNVITYVDAEISSMIKHDDQIKGTDFKAKLNNLDLNIIGILKCGGENNTQEIGFNGLLSKVTIFNYDLNSRDITNNYNDGPINGILSSVGYGLQYPLYKL